MAEVKVTVSGPLFAPGAEQVLDEMAEVSSYRLMTEGKRRVLRGLDATLRKPTGAYRKRVTTYGPVAGQSRVHDDRAIYGPWLEGTGSRNRTTRFKGYRNWRTATKELRAGAPHLVNQVVAEKLYKLGG